MGGFLSACFKYSLAFFSQAKRPDSFMVLIQITSKVLQVGFLSLSLFCFLFFFSFHLFEEKRGNKNELKKKDLKNLSKSYPCA